MGFGRLFHKEGPMYDQRRVSLEKRVLKPYKTISYVSSAVRSEFKHFIRIEGVLLLTNIKAIGFMNWWTLSLVGNQFIDLKSVRDI